MTTPRTKTRIRELKAEMRHSWKLAEAQLRRGRTLDKDAARQNIRNAVRLLKEIKQLIGENDGDSHQNNRNA